MQGTWKETVGGYHKDIKRKRQTRKHSIKDKAQGYWKRFIKKDIDNEYIRDDGNNFVKTTIETFKQGSHIEVYNVEVWKFIGVKECKNTFSNETYRYDDFKIYYTVAYEINNTWYDYNTNELIYSRWDKNRVNKRQFLFKKYIHFGKKEPKIRTSTPYTESEYYIYGKPIVWKEIKKYVFGRSKYAGWFRTHINRLDRRYAKEFCQRGDFEGGTIMTSIYSKSIKWGVD